MIMSVGGLAQGVSFLLGKSLSNTCQFVVIKAPCVTSGGLIIVPTLGPRPSLGLASLMFSLAPVFSWATLPYLHTRYWSSRDNHSFIY